MKNTNTNTETIATVTLTDMANIAYDIPKNIAYKKLSPHFKKAHDAFLANAVDSSLYGKLCATINKVNGTHPEREIVAKLAKKIPSTLYKGMDDLTEYQKATANISLMSTILNYLCSNGVLGSEIVDTAYYVNGKKMYQRVKHIKFNECKDDRRDLLRGLHLEPGVVMQKYIQSKAGGRSMKITGAQKEVLANLSSRPVKLISGLEAESLTAYFKSTSWYINALEAGSEGKVALNYRVNKYVENIIDVSKLDKFYLSYRFDYRYRVYTDLQHEGLSPQGDKLGKYIYELVTPEVITELGFRELVHSAVTIGHKRLNIEQSLKYWEKHEFKIRATLLREENFASVTYHRRLLKAIDDYRTGTPSSFILFKDFTTGGPLLFSLSFASEKLMKLTNVGGLKTAQDAHGTIGKMFGLTREQSKQITTPLFHGSSYESISDKLKSVFDIDMSVEEIESNFKSAVGEEIVNLQAIMNFCRLAHSSENPSLLFSTPDGWKTQTTAYCKGTSAVYYGLNPDVTKGYTQVTVGTDLPLVTTHDGSMIFENNKISGGFANMTHNLDSYVLRRIAVGVPQVKLFIHDNFGCHPNYMPTVNAVAKEVFKDISKLDYYKQACEQIAYNMKGISKPTVPTFIYGKKNKVLPAIEKSSNFLMA